MRMLAAVVKIAVFFTGVAVIVPVHFAVFLLTQSMVMTRVFHRWGCFVFNVRVRNYGQVFLPPDEKARVLYVGNHISYFDILVLGGHIPASFVAKSEVAGWPIFGFLSRLQNTVFIERKRLAADTARKQLLDAFHRGANLILFPEGTSGDGRDVLPFRAGLLEAVLTGVEPDLRLWVQPFAITIAAVDGQGAAKMGAKRDVYAWYGDMTLAPHLVKLAMAKRVDIDVQYLPPVDPAAYTGRKALAKDLHAAIAARVQNK